MKRSVLQLIGSFNQGGTERQAVQLTRLLCESGAFNVFVATLNKDGVLLGEIQGLDLPDIQEFKLASFYDINFLSQLWKFVAMLGRNEISIIHTHDFYTNIFGMLGARVAGVSRKIASKRETAGMRSFGQQFVENRSFSTADFIVANSENVKEHLIQSGTSLKKIRVIHNGLDLARFDGVTTDRKAICETLSLPADEDLRFITLVANLQNTVKNHPMFLRTASRVIQRFPRTHFVMAGAGDLETDLKMLARKMKIEGNTHFLGRCEKIPELLSVTYVGVLTSFSEGFSNSILEYMGAGKPVVATNVGGASEAVVDGETGFLVDSDDDEMMATRLMELLENNSMTLEFGRVGRLRVERKFSTESQLKNTLKLYDC